MRSQRGSVLRGLLVLLAGVLLVAVCTRKPSGPATGAATADPMAGVREACRQFIEGSMRDPKPIEFGSYWDWTVQSNSDGTLSVGAKYTAGASARYSTCVVRRVGGDIKLVSLTRLQ